MRKSVIVSVIVAAIALGAAIIVYGSLSVNDETDEVSPGAVDAIPPTALTRDHISLVGETFTASDFVWQVSGASEVSVVYAEEPDFLRPGAQDVVVALEDLEGNRTELTARLYVFGIRSAIEVEAGTAGIALRDYLIDAPGLDGLYGEISVSLMTGVTGAQLRRTGDYEVILRVNGRLFTTIVTVVDTTPPDATVVDHTWWLGMAVDPMSFFEEVRDYSEVTARYLSPPDIHSEGTQMVSIVLEDSWGNGAVFTAWLTLVPDTEPPVISGAEDQSVFIGSSIAYRAGVSAYDNADGEIAFSVDSSAVNIYESGRYEVIYSAVDSSGNETSVTVIITVMELNTEIVYAMADAILESITNPEMSLLEKARRIHTWIRSSIVYSYASEKTNVIDGAYAGFRTRQGDCFTFYAVAEVLLTRAEIPNMRVTRYGGATAHYWNLINVGTGWYHFDATPTRERVDNFMFTSLQAEEFTRLIPQVPNYYVYDKSLYPRVVGDEVEPRVRIPALFPEITCGKFNGERSE